MKTADQPVAIRNPQEFKRLYFSSWDHLSCEPTGSRDVSPDHCYLEVTSLEKLRANIKGEELPPNRRSFFTVVLLTGGEVGETIGFKQYTFRPHTVYFIAEGQLHSVGHWSRDVQGFHCLFDADYFLLCLRNQVKLNTFPFFQSDKSPFMELSVSEAEAVSELFRKMNLEYCRRKTINDDLLVRLYLNVLLIELERIFSRKGEPESITLPTRYQLVSRFKQLVEKHYLDKRKVSQYAELLFVTPHYLNDTVREMTGKPASAYIQQQLLLEAKAQLIQTDNTITQIAAYINFSDQSYFCRFFRKMTGISPAQYRQGSHRHTHQEANE